MNRLKEIEEMFSEYVSNNFDLENIDIRRKFNHSKRVKLLCDEIALDLELNDDDRFLVNIVGLLHDYGRFFQITTYNTMNDLKSVDHGSLGADFLFSRGDIRKYPIDVKHYDEIYDAIKHHNQYSIPDHLSEHNKLILKIIRDADKLDILKLFSIAGTSFKEDDSDISENIKDDFYMQKQTLITKEKTNNDQLIIILCFVFDLNYKYSFKYLKNKKIIENIYKCVNDKVKFKEYFDYLIKYVNLRAE